MSKIKNYMMDIEEKVFDIDGLETKIGECEHPAEMKESLWWRSWV